MPAAFMSRKESCAMRRSTGLRVMRAAPVAIFAGSPMLPTTTTWSTRYCGMEILGERGYWTRLSVTAMTWAAFFASVIA